MPSGISPRRALSNRSTHFRNRCRGVNLGIQDSSDMCVFLVICKERLPVIKSLVVSTPHVYDGVLGYLPSSLLRRIHEDRELGGSRNIPLRMLLMRPDPPCRSVQVTGMKGEIDVHHIVATALPIYPPICRNIINLSIDRNINRPVHTTSIIPCQFLRCKFLQTLCEWIIR
jgi:hypothetical protein